MEKLVIVIGENDFVIPDYFNEVEFYIRDNDELKLYGKVTLPYLINHIEVLDIEDDPRYILYEGYDNENGSSKYICSIKVFGNMRGVYRLGLGTPFKIRDIEINKEIKTRSLRKDNVVC